jgi:hypothetical protein
VKFLWRAEDDRVDVGPSQRILETFRRGKAGRRGLGACAIRWIDAKDRSDDRAGGEAGGNGLSPPTEANDRSSDHLQVTVVLMP